MKLNKRLGLLALVAVAGGGTAGYAMLDHGPAFPVHFASPDLLAALMARSPGTRHPGAVTTKHKIVHKAKPVAHHHKRKRVAAVLPASEPAPVPLAPPAPVAEAVAAPLGAPVAAVPETAAAPLLAPAAVPVAAFSGPGAAALLPLAIIPVAAVVGGGGGGGTTTITPVTPVTPPTGPAVPEPATWLMMILGFGFLGTFLRRERKHRSLVLATAKVTAQN